MLGDILWPLAAMVVGVAAVLQLGVLCKKGLEVKKIRTEIQRTQITRELEITQAQTRDGDFARERARVDWELTQTPEGKQLKQSEMALQTAQNLLKAKETEAKAAYADDVARAAAENEKIANRARMQALVDQANIWAQKNPPKAPQDPVESMNLTEAYKKYCAECRYLGHKPLGLGEWLGANYYNRYGSNVRTDK